MKDKLKNSGVFRNISSAAIIGAGVLLRLIYVLRSTIYDRQYDIGMIDLDAGHTVTGGHLAYIQYLYHNLRLPDMDPTTVYQFHHPPVHHYICALWMRFLGLFTDNTDFLEESIQVIPFICSLIILYCAVRIFLMFGLRGYALNCATLIICFHPSLILLSGSVNNDCMALMFTMLVILSTMKWIDSGKTGAIILSAVFLGLGISTKQNVAEFAFPLAIVFLWVLIKKVREKGDLKVLIGQYALFGVISIPLGMWFYIRNLVKYGVSILWVYELPADSWQYTGNIPVVNRFLWPIPSEMIDNLKNFKIGCGYNVWMQMMRTSVLGEWDMASVGKGIKLIAVLLMLAGAFVAVVAFGCFVKSFLMHFTLKDGAKLNPLYRILFVTGYIAVMISYLLFAYKYPQQCSMHFRYIEITLLLPTVGLGLVYEKSRKKSLKIFRVLYLGVFSLLSVAMCCVWSFM